MTLGPWNAATLSGTVWIDGFCSMIAVPCEPEPLVLDLAMSVVANGKILQASKTGAAIPEGWAIDADGAATTDPVAALGGLVLPFAGYKGYGLSFMTALLAGVLGGAAAGTDVGDYFTDFATPQNVGHWMLALDVGRFCDPGEFAVRAGALADLMRSARPAPGVSEILVPGDPETRAALAQASAGIFYEAAVLAELAAEAGRLGVAPLTGGAR